MQKFTCYILNGKVKIKLIQPKLASSLACTKIQNKSSAPAIVAAVNSGASDHYFPSSYQGEDSQPVATPHAVGTANCSVMRSVSTD